jgi:bifunctional non-homologous end joining protein LigD
MRAGRRNVRITHPDKSLFPDGTTKADLAAYYRDVAPAMLPHVRERPVSMQRFNAGIGRPGFFQKDVPKGAPEWVPIVTVPKKGGTVRHVLANETATLVWLANQNCITPHVWSARADRLDRPDRIVFDLDPPEGVSFGAIRAAALALGGHLRGLELEPFAMTTGSRGIHVVAPLRRTRTADVVREAAGAIAAEVAADHDDTLTTEWRKAKRADRILVDTARNTYAQTVVAPYALRALPGAPVATPLAWDELEDPRLNARRWTLRTIGERLDARGDPWADISRHARALPRVRH